MPRYMSLLSALASFSDAIAISFRSPALLLPANDSSSSQPPINDPASLVPLSISSIPPPLPSIMTVGRGPPWPELPISRFLGGNLYLLVTALGAPATTLQSSAIAQNLANIMIDILSEGNPVGLIETFIFTHGFVTVEFGDGPWIILTRGQACKVVRAVMELEVAYAPTEILRSNVFLEHSPIATLNMTFSKELLS